MTLPLARVIPGLLIWSTALASEPPSRFVARAGTTEVHIPDVIERGKQRIKLQDFAVAGGKAWAKAGGKPGDYFVIPVRVVGRGPIPPTATLTMLCPKREIPMVDASWWTSSASPDSGRSYQGVAVFPEACRIKDIVGFVYVDGDTFRCWRED